MSFPYGQNSMSAFLFSPLLFFFFACMASSSQRCFRPWSNHPTWSHIIKQLWGKLIPSEHLVFHTFQFKAITHSGLLLQRGLCQAPHLCPPIHPSLAIPRVSSVTHHHSTSISVQRFFFQWGYFVLLPSRFVLLGLLFFFQFLLLKVHLTGWLQYILVKTYFHLICCSRIYVIYLKIHLILSNIWLLTFFTELVVQVLQTPNMSKVQYNALAACLAHGIASYTMEGRL